jgi:hypothetical protein
MSKGTVLLLCNLTDAMGADWVNAGYRVVMVDPQHQAHTNDGNVERINKTILEAMPRIGEIMRNEKVVFVAGFPPCTDVAVSGAAHFESKRQKDAHFQAKAALTAEQCRTIGELCGCPWFFENPVSVFASIFGKPDCTFNPSDFGGYLPEDDQHPEWPEIIAARDAYPKKTCLWTGGGFELPPLKPVPVRTGYSDQHHKLGGKSIKTKNIRSATPRGFARAVFEMYGAEK